MNKHVQYAVEVLADHYGMTQEMIRRSLENTQKLVNISVRVPKSKIKSEKNTQPNMRGARKKKPFTSSTIRALKKTRTNRGILTILLRAKIGSPITRQEAAGVAGALGKYHKTASPLECVDGHWKLTPAAQPLVARLI